jgi:alkylation response protein AidB-like acyl-CoA dehydrogenase
MYSLRSLCELINLLTKEHEFLFSQSYRDSEQYLELLRNLASFLEERIIPLSEKTDRGEVSISEQRKELFKQGICSIPFNTAFGGLELPFTVYVAAMELVGAADASIALSMGIHNTVADILSIYGSEEQKKEILPELITGKKLAAFALTEPSSGSDAKSMNTRAERKGNKFVLNGSKTYITNAPEADIFLIFASSENGPVCLVVDRQREGLQVGRNMEKLGMRGSLTSEVFFSDCIVDSSSLVGKEGQGFEYAKTGLNSSRVVMGSICVGIANIAYMKAISFSRQRKAFGSIISSFQLIREKIANMKIRINASRNFCFLAARMREMGLDFSSYAAQAKVFATESALDVCDSAIQIFGGQGYTSSDVNRHWRDARLLTIGEGTSEVLRMLIARKELRDKI